MKNAIRCLASTLLAFLLFSVSSCFQKFYKTNSISRPPEEKLVLAASERKTVVVHYSDSNIQLKDVVVRNDTIWGNPAPHSVNQKYMNPSAEKPNRMHKEDIDEVLAQIHLYVNESMPINNDMIYIESAKIARFDIYDFDKEATKKSKNAGIIGFIVAGVATILAILGILAATAEHYF